MLGVLQLLKDVVLHSIVLLNPHRNPGSEMMRFCSLLELQLKMLSVADHSLTRLSFGYLQVETTM